MIDAAGGVAAASPAPQAERGHAARRFPGFDGVRLSAAVLVMFSHAFLIATGTEEREPLTRLLGPGHVLGVYAVFSFFIISGFLLAGSLEANPSAGTYALHRTLRIVPGFVFAVLVTAFVVGPVCSSLSLSDYFHDASVYGFVRTSLETLGDAELPGVFGYAEHAGLSSVVNGSLWSLRYEALSYVLLLLVWAAVSSSGRLAAVFVIGGLCAWLFPWASVLTSVAFTLPYFAGGVLMHWVHRRFGMDRRCAALALALLVAAGWSGHARYAFALLGAYLVVFAGERANPMSWIVARLGDCTYGVYLYAWPSQQIVKQVTGTSSPLTLFALSAPLALGLGLVSYHLIEAPAMRLRRPVNHAVRRGVRWLLDQAGRARGAAAAGARAAFVVAGASILAAGPWWLVFESVASIVLWTTLGAIVAVLGYHAATPFRSRRPV